MTHMHTETRTKTNTQTGTFDTCIQRPGQRQLITQTVIHVHTHSHMHACTHTHTSMAVKTPELCAAVYSGKDMPEVIGSESRAQAQTTLQPMLRMYII